MKVTPQSLVRETLDHYSKLWPKGVIAFAEQDLEHETQTMRDLYLFLESEPKGLERSCLVGHFTGSALVVNPKMDRVLLTLHAKLGKWLQLGGHVDGDHNIADAALREAREESGRAEVELFPWNDLFHLKSTTASPFDIDIHEIPARASEPSHFHYDIRFLCVLDDSLPLQITSESKDLRWLSLDEARSVTQERSMLRQFDKLAVIRERHLTLT